MKIFCRIHLLLFVTIFFVGKSVYPQHNELLPITSPELFSDTLITQMATATTTNAKPSWLISLAGQHVLTVIAFELFFLFSSAQAQKIILEQLTVQNITATAAYEYITHLITTIMHEGGHAIAATILTGSSATINIGATTNGNPLFSFGKINITGINPTTGLTTYKIPQNTTAKKKAAIFLAGGMGGIIGHYAIKILFALMQKNGNPLAINRIAGASAPDSIFFEQLAMMSLPYEAENGCKSDGARILENCVGLPKTITQKATPLVPLLELLAQFYLIDQEKENKEITPFDEFLVALINYQLRGYFRFHL